MNYLNKKNFERKKRGKNTIIQKYKLSKLNHNRFIRGIIIKRGRLKLMDSKEKLILE